MNATINIATDGTIRAVYSDELAALDLGPLTVTRASQVEFNATRQQWEVHFVEDPAGQIAYAAASRAECIAWEVEQLNERIAAL